MSEPMSPATLTEAELRTLKLALETLTLPLRVEMTADYAEVYEANTETAQAMALTMNTAWVDLVNALPALLSIARQSAGDGWRSQALDAVAAERRRQVEVEGWTPEHDDEHDKADLADAAACYAKRAQFGASGPSDGLLGPPGWWPWDVEWWRPAAPRMMLIKAGALIVAEIERLDRLPAPPTGGSE